jgi:hypothetical protein
VPLEILSLVLVGDLAELWVHFTDHIAFTSFLSELITFTDTIFYIHSEMLGETIWPAPSAHLHKEVRLCSSGGLSFYLHTFIGLVLCAHISFCILCSEQDHPGHAQDRKLIVRVT